MVTQKLLGIHLLWDFRGEVWGWAQRLRVRNTVAVGWQLFFMQVRGILNIAVYCYISGKLNSQSQVKRFLEFDFNQCFRSIDSCTIILFFRQDILVLQKIITNLLKPTILYNLQMN